jgi:hypothetical protein
MRLATPLPTPPSHPRALGSASRRRIVATSSRWRIVVGFCLALVSLETSHASAGENFVASVERVWFRADTLKVDFDIVGLFSDRLRDGLSRGLPMTFNVQIDLWRTRAGWWDALESRAVRRFKVQRNVFDDRFFVHADDGKRVIVPDLAALERHLSIRRAELVSSIANLPREKSYYVAVTPSLRPLTIEDIQQVEAWLNGEIEESRDETAVSVITGVPRMFFNMAVDLAGLGDKSTLARSGTFRLDAFVPDQSGDRPED